MLKMGLTGAKKVVLSLHGCFVVDLWLFGASTVVGGLTLKITTNISEVCSNIISSRYKNK